MKRCYRVSEEYWRESPPPIPWEEVQLKGEGSQLAEVVVPKHSPSCIDRVQ